MLRIQIRISEFGGNDLSVKDTHQMEVIANIHI